MYENYEAITLGTGNGQMGPFMTELLKVLKSSFLLRFNLDLFTIFLRDLSHHGCHLMP